nr:MAG TPA: YtxH-like protein [Caudoviricetes sp.]
MTNWMWFISGAIAGGLITGVTSFFIFKKKKDEMERKYTNMVNDFFRHDDDDFKRDMDDAVKTAKEVIDIYSGESDDMFDDDDYPDDEFEMFSSEDDELTDDDVICYEKDYDYAGVPEDCYVDASTDVMIIDSSEYGEISTYQMIQWEYNTEKDKMYDLKGREITDYTDYVGDAFKRIFKETDEDAVYIQNNTLKRYYEIAEDLS